MSVLVLFPKGCSASGLVDPDRLGKGVGYREDRATWPLVQGCGCARSGGQGRCHFGERAEGTACIQARGFSFPVALPIMITKTFGFLRSGFRTSLPHTM